MLTVFSSFVPFIWCIIKVWGWHQYQREHKSILIIDCNGNIDLYWLTIMTINNLQQQYSRCIADEAVEAATDVSAASGPLTHGKTVHFDLASVKIELDHRQDQHRVSLATPNTSHKFVTPKLSCQETQILEVELSYQINQSKQHSCLQSETCASLTNFSSFKSHIICMGMGLHKRFFLCFCFWCDAGCLGHRQLMAGSRPATVDSLSQSMKLESHCGYWKSTTFVPVFWDFESREQVIL